MGGPGSGRSEYASTPTVEDCLILDVNQFSDAVAHPGMSLTYRWWEDDAPISSLGVQLLPRHGDAETASALRLAYTFTNGRRDMDTHLDYRVELDYTECHFGGERPWFRCPGGEGEEPCGQRVGKLYRPPQKRLFLCRHCHDLGYTSSRTSGDALKQAELRYRRVYAKVDEHGRRPHPNSVASPAIPHRPSRMHHDTYDDLVAELAQARREWYDAYEAQAERIAARFKNVPGWKEARRELMNSDQSTEPTS